MLIEYKGYEIDVKRVESFGGDIFIYASVVRISDGYVLLSSFEFPTFYKNKSIRKIIENFKKDIDNYLNFEKDKK